MSQLYTAASTVAGKGLFTAVHITAKSIIFRFEGERIYHDYTPEFALEGANWIGVGDREWLIPEADDPVLFLNHSCNPNVFITRNLEVISARDIPANAELLLDYSSTELDPFWKMNCNCGSADCRHVVRNFSSLPLAKQLQYRNYIHPVFWMKTEQKIFK